MTTLYDLLGALPNDDAEELRSAFRKAVKSAHPDINPGDPDAAMRFRQIVRANEILADGEQRAAYDHLLELAREEQEQDSKRAVAAKVHKFASGVLAVASASAVTVGGYLLFMHMSTAAVAPLKPTAIAADRFKIIPVANVARPAETVVAATPAPPLAPPLTSPLALTAPDAELSPTEPAEIAEIMRPPEQPLATVVKAEPPRSEKVASAEDERAPCTSGRPAAGCAKEASKEPVKEQAKESNREAAKDTTASVPTGRPLGDARFYHDRGMAAFRKGDLAAAVADLDQAIQLDPKFSGAYLDRGIVFYKMRKFDRAFADVATSRRIERANRAVSDAIARKQQVRPIKLEQPPKMTRVSQRHTSGVAD